MSPGRSRRRISPRAGGGDARYYRRQRNEAHRPGGWRQGYWIAAAVLAGVVLTAVIAGALVSQEENLPLPARLGKAYRLP